MRENKHKKAWVNNASAIKKHYNKPINDILMQLSKTLFFCINSFMIWFPTLFLYSHLSIAGQPAPTAAIFQNNPSGTATLATNAWHTEFITEPVFNSKIFILQAGQADRPAVVLVHGLGNNASADWHDSIPALAQKFHVIAVDLPGFGQSEHPAGKYSPTHYAQVVHHVIAHYAAGKAIVIGHSMGGAVALRHAALYPDDVARLVLVDAAGILERTAFVKGITEIPFEIRGAPPFLDKALSRLRDFQSSVVELVTRLPDPTDLLNTQEGAWTLTATDASSANAATAMIEENFTAAVHTLTVPTEIMWGEQDRLAPFRTGRLLAGQIQNARLTTFPDAGHVPMKSHRLEFNAKLLTLLQDTAPPPKQSPPFVTEGKTLRCTGQSGLTYRGNYDKIIIENCNAIKLIDVNATSLQIHNSLVEMENTRIQSSKVALTANESVVLATNITLEGDIAIISNGSRLDLAGATLQGKKTAVSVKTKSRLIFSVSRLINNKRNGDLHGDYELNSVTLDQSL